MLPPPDPVLDAWAADIVAGFPPMTAEVRAAVAVLIRRTSVDCSRAA